jgi:hypothetical protein
VTPQDFEQRPAGTLPVVATLTGEARIGQVVSVGPQSITMRGTDGYDNAWPITEHSDPLARLKIIAWEPAWRSTWFNGAND